MEKRLDLIFGSDSDEDKVLPGIVRFTTEHPGWQVKVHYASADNTPGKVNELMEELVHLPVVEAVGRHVYISGAGMSNVLTGVVKKCASSSDLIIGIPITDSKTKGLSSLLSTSEKPPLNPVLTVGLDDTYAALNIASRFLAGGRKARPVVVFDFRSGYDIQYNKEEPCDAAQKIMHELKCFGQPFELKQMGSLDRDDIVISPFYSYRDNLSGIHGVDDTHLRDVDGILIPGNGIQVAVYAGGDIPLGYDNSLKCTRSTGLVSIGSYKNAAQMAALLACNDPALNIIKAVKDAKIEKLNNHRGLLVVNGEVRKL